MPRLAIVQRSMGSRSPVTRVAAIAAPTLFGARRFDFGPTSIYGPIAPEQHRVTRAPGKAIGGGEDLSRTPAKYRVLLRLTDREIGRLFDELAGREILDIELANRKLFRTEYPAIHASLIVCPCAAAAVAVRLAGDGEGLSGRGGSAASESA